MRVTPVSCRILQKDDLHLFFLILQYFCLSYLITIAQKPYPVTSWKQTYYIQSYSITFALHNQRTLYNIKMRPNFSEQF